MKLFLFSIQNDVLSGVVDTYKLSKEILGSSIIIATQSIKTNLDVLTIEFKANIGTLDGDILTNLVMNHNGEADPRPKIANYLDFDLNKLDYRDVNYVIAPKPNLYPDRQFVKGELQVVCWYSDVAKTDLVLKAEIVYNRDAFDLAISRDTTRTWYDENSNALSLNTVSTKVYSGIEQIKEGKRRRGNIVDGMQLPTMGFMVETMTVAPYNLDSSVILLMGRDFLDRHELDFVKFIDNSSSITDISDPNFGKKTIVVAIEAVALTTDTWLKNTPAALQGATIEDYLVGEFSI